MGALTYNGQFTVELDDDLVAHLRVVVMDKLRRGEPFMLTFPAQDGSGGRRSLWLAPAIPLGFRVNRSGPDRLQRERIAALLRGANGPDGLDLAPHLSPERDPTAGRRS